MSQDRTQRDHPNWYAVDPQGNRVMNVTSLSDEDIKKVMSWKSSQVSNQHDLEYLNNVDVGVEAGVNEGRRHAESISILEAGRSALMTTKGILL